jgi:hypothetical protein
VGGVRTARVEGDDGPRRMMGGWLAARLGLAADAVELEAAEHVSVEIEAEVDGRRGRFSVRRTGDERMIDAYAEIDGGPSHDRSLRLRERSAARVLGEALSRTGHDRVWEEALAAAIGAPGVPH